MSVPEIQLSSLASDSITEWWLSNVYPPSLHTAPAPTAVYQHVSRADHSLGPRQRPQRLKGSHNPRAAQSALHLQVHRVPRHEERSIRGDESQRPHSSNRGSQHEHRAVGVGRHHTVPTRNPRQTTQHQLCPQPKDYFEATQWLFYQVSSQGPYFEQAVWFVLYHLENLPSVVNRYVNETRRVSGVLARVLQDKEILVGGYGGYLKAFSELRNFWRLRSILLLGLRRSVNQVPTE